VSTNNHVEEYFYSLTPDKILAAVENSGVRCTGRMLQLGSFENRVYEVEIECDPEPKHKADSFRVVKFYRPSRWTEQQLQEEHEFLQELLQEDIPVVAPLLLDNGTTLARSEHIYYAVFPKVQGRRPEEPSDAELRQLGRLVARMHLIGKKKAAKSRRTLDTQSFGLDSLAFLRSAQVIPSVLVERYAQLVEGICQKSSVLLDALPKQRIHGDCHLGNVLQGQAGFFFLDFDDMVMGPVVQDLWLLAGGRDEEGKRQRDQLLSGYEEFASFDERSLRLIEPLRALRYVHYCAWIAKRWQDPIFPRTFPHFKAQDYWIHQLQDLEEVLDLM
jgi:Ser/Thr protein kinase RdoA (MazF antagonist)